MPAWIAYFRKHRWQRRLLTGSLAALLGAVAAIVALPHVRDHLLLRDLASSNAAVRAGAISRAVERAGKSPRTLRRLNEALDEASDRQFAAIVAALKWLGEFKVPGRKGEHVDRMWALELAGNPDAENRAMFLAEMLLAGRDNRYVRLGLSAAARDESADVRALSAALAARLGDDAALAALLEDADPNVSATAALDAGIARRASHSDRLRKMMGPSAGLSRRSAAAYALARIDPNGSAEALSSLLARADEAGDAKLRDRLLHVLCECPSPAARSAVPAVLERARRAGRHPPAMALAAAAKLRLTEAGPDVRNLLAAAVEAKGAVTIRQVHAALRAAEALGLPVRKEVNAICRTFWTYRPGFKLMLMAAARVLGRQARRPQAGREDVPSTADCIQTLRMAAVQDYEPTTYPAGTKPRLINTPMPSAAAAVALWHLETPAAEEFLRNSAGEPTTLPGDYVSWHLGVTGVERAYRFGLTLLPPLDAPPDERVYNDERRSAGALLLAIAARTDAQRAGAAERVRSRLLGGDLGGEDDFHVRGAYRCALAILGDRESLREVAGLLGTGQFSQRRAITALTLSGELAGLDWMLWNRQVPADDMLFLLVDEQVSDILAACLPEAPAVDAAAGDDLAAWQLQILRHWYAIHRAKLRPRWPPR